MPSMQRNVSPRAAARPFTWAVILILCASPAFALDTIRLVTGGAMPGHVVGMDSSTVQLEQRSGEKIKEVPVNQIQVIHYEGEPRELQNAKSNVAAGHYAEALAALDRI
ncbi:MAG: hypothetical protein ABFC96_13510, partial [Thermoguttaceae bacterium]